MTTSTPHNHSDVAYNTIPYVNEARSHLDQAVIRLTSATPGLWFSPAASAYVEQLQQTANQVRGFSDQCDAVSRELNTMANQLWTWDEEHSLWGV
ncbi:MAG: hypothetical protein LBR27_11585 [Bifidobacteriaceae bacterium]|nr:hypothetical protein [Bifidobacteriaceae bacterium]